MTIPYNFVEHIAKGIIELKRRTIFRRHSLKRLLPIYSVVKNIIDLHNCSITDTTQHFDTDNPPTLHVTDTLASSILKKKRLIDVRCIFPSLEIKQDKETQSRCIIISAENLKKHLPKNYYILPSSVVQHPSNFSLLNDSNIDRETQLVNCLGSQATTTIDVKEFINPLISEIRPGYIPGLCRWLATTLKCDNVLIWNSLLDRSFDYLHLMNLTKIAELLHFFTEGKVIHEQFLLKSAMSLYFRLESETPCLSEILFFVTFFSQFNHLKCTFEHLQLRLFRYIISRLRKQTPSSFQILTIVSLYKSPSGICFSDSHLKLKLLAQLQQNMSLHKTIQVCSSKILPCKDKQIGLKESSLVVFRGKTNNQLNTPLLAINQSFRGKTTRSDGILSPGDSDEIWDAPKSQDKKIIFRCLRILKELKQIDPVESITLSSPIWSIYTPCLWIKPIDFINRCLKNSSLKRLSCYLKEFTIHLTTERHTQKDELFFDRLCCTLQCYHDVPINPSKHTPQHVAVYSYLANIIYDLGKLNHYNSNEIMNSVTLITTAKQLIEIILPNIMILDPNSYLNFFIGVISLPWDNPYLYQTDLTRPVFNQFFLRNTELNGVSKKINYRFSQTDQFASLSKTFFSIVPHTKEPAFSIDTLVEAIQIISSLRCNNPQTLWDIQYRTKRPIPLCAQTAIGSLTELNHLQHTIEHYLHKHLNRIDIKQIGYYVNQIKYSVSTECLWTILVIILVRLQTHLSVIRKTDNKQGCLPSNNSNRDSHTVMNYNRDETSATIIEAYNQPLMIDHVAFKEIERFLKSCQKKIDKLYYLDKDHTQYSQRRAFYVMKRCQEEKDHIFLALVNCIGGLLYDTKEFQTKITQRKLEIVDQPYNAMTNIESNYQLIGSINSVKNSWVIVQKKNKSLNAGSKNLIKLHKTLCSKIYTLVQNQQWRFENRCDDMTIVNKLLNSENSTENSIEPIITRLSISNRLLFMAQEFIDLWNRHAISETCFTQKKKT